MKLDPQITVYQHCVSIPTNCQCIADCHFTEMGVLRNGKIDLKSLRNVTKNELGPNEPEAQDAISRLAEMCVRVTGEQKDAIAKAGTKCSVLAYAFFKCLGDGVFSNCPDKYWSTSKHRLSSVGQSYSFNVFCRRTLYDIRQRGPLM